MSRTAVAILSTENLLHNINLIKSKVAPAKVIAMVKANAYGHGIRSVGLRLDDHADLLGVASIDEALILRKVGVNAPIILMQGVFEPDELLVASTEKFHVVFNNPAQVDWLDRNPLPLPLSTWIKINTGMGRLGFELRDAQNILTRLTEHALTKKPINVMSHFACSEDANHPLNQTQIHAFKEFAKDLKGQLSLCNSGGILNFSDCYFDYVRPGLLLYGASPLPGKTGEDLGFKPVMTVLSSLISVQTLEKGECVGYGARYVCPKDMRVGIVAFGYGDGYPFTAKDGTPVLVNNVRCSLIGRVSMDMIAIDLNACPNAKIGDKAVLWGENLPIEEVSRCSDNSVWTLMTGVQNRVKFLWTQRS